MAVTSTRRLANLEWLERGLEQVTGLMEGREDEVWSYFCSNGTVTGVTQCEWAGTLDNDADSWALLQPLTQHVWDWDRTFVNFTGLPCNSLCKLKFEACREKPRGLESASRVPLRGSPGLFHQDWSRV